MSSSTVRATNYPAIKNAPVVGLAEGNGSFSNTVLVALVLVVPYVVKSITPLVSRGGLKTYLFLLLITGLPTTIAYWIFMSIYGPRKNEKVVLPNKDITEYIEFKDKEMKAKYVGKEKINIQEFHDAYFDGKVDVKGMSLSHLLLSDPELKIRVTGDILDILEQRHDWAKFNMNAELMKYVVFTLIPEVAMHTKDQDLEQVRGHYDRMFFFSPFRISLFF
jgi:hypothetical protein